MINTPIIVFDLGGVLINLNVERCIGQFRELMGDANMQAVLGLGSDGEGVSAVSVASRQLMADFERGRISSQFFLGEIQRFCLPGTTISRIADAWMSMLDKLPQERLDYLERLKAQGHHLYLLSNGNDLHFDYINRTYHLDRYFERMFLSQRMHLAKPDPAIFREVDAAINPNHEPVIFIDDLPQNRLAAEAAVHWRTFSDINVNL